MSGRQIVTIIVFASVLFVGHSAYRIWVQEQASTKKIVLESLRERFQSEQEIRRMELLARALDSVPQGGSIKVESDKAKHALTRAGAVKSRSRILGVEITGQEAQQLIGQERRQGEGRRLDGRYTVVEISADIEDGWLVKLLSADGAAPFEAEVSQRDLTRGDIDVIFFSIRAGEVIDLQVNAWLVGDKVRRARIRPAMEVGDE